MLVRVLGAVELVTDEGEVVALPGSRQAALLAALAARANEVVSSDRLVTLLWGDDLPARPEAALHSVVFKLRASLRSASGREMLQTREHGYQLLLRPGDLDAEVFLDLVAAARDVPPATATGLLAEALALWRGPAYAGTSDTEIAHLEAMRLEETRRTAVERLAAALYAAGRPEEAVVLLEPFVAEHPLREEARVTLMQALHRVGRTGDALEHYQEHRRQLADELGLEPSQAMQRLQTELLRQPGPEPEPPSSAAPATSTPRGLPGLQVRYLRTARGRTLAYGVTGEGPPLVVILGWLSSLDVIGSGRDPRSSVLERLAGRLSLTLYDRQGTGLSPGPVDDYGLEPSVVEALEVIEAVGPPVSLLAMSAAGPIAVSAAARRPDWVSALVLFGTFASGPATFTDKRMRDMITDIARSHWGMGSKILADLYRPGASDEAAWHLARVFRESASAEVAADYLAAIFDQDVTDLLPAVDIPTLVLHYRGDRLIPFRGSQDLASGLPRATLVPLDGRVHLPDARNLDQIEKAIVEHVRRHG